MTKYEDLVLYINKDLYSYIIDLMTSEQPEIQALALRFVSQGISSEQTNLTELALKRGVLTKFQLLLNSNNPIIVKETLWGLSNFAAENEAHTNALLSEEVLLDRVMKLITNV